jgi:hypothetical protein
VAQSLRAVLGADDVGLEVHRRRAPAPAMVTSGRRQ